MIVPGAIHIASDLLYVALPPGAHPIVFSDVTTWPSGGVVLVVVFVVIIALAVLFANRSGALPHVTGDVLDAPSLDMPLPAGTAPEGDDVDQEERIQHVV